MAIYALALFWTTKAFLSAMTARQTDHATSRFAAVGFNDALRRELSRSAPGRPGA